MIKEPKTLDQDGHGLWSVLFHYNVYKKEWACFNRDDQRNYFNGEEPSSKIGRGKTMEDAIVDKNYQSEDK